MRRYIVFTIVVLPFALALPLMAVGLLSAPTGFTAVLNSGAGVIETDWDVVTGATKYSVNVVAGYNTNGDGAADVSMDFDFGTSDRTDGLPMDTPSLDIPLADMTLDVNGDGVDDAPFTAQARVKALAPGKGKGRQDNPFCALVTVF